MHCAERFGRTERLIEADGFVAAERLDWVTDTPGADAQAGRALEMVGAGLNRHGVDAMVLVGDRFETAAAAVAATLERVPLVHLHGGEESAGAFDDQLRNAVTKLSHLHLVSHPDHARRVIAMGESPDTVHVVGAPGLDNANRNDLATRAELEHDLGLSLEPPVVLVTLQPTTLGGPESSKGELNAIVAAMERVPATYVITLPNNDPGAEPVRETLTTAGRSDGRVAVEALGERRYWGLLRVADAMIGNSSSALIEAPTVGLPAVNVGDRQRGRLRAANVVDVPANDDSVTAALQEALSPASRKRLVGMVSPFGDGHSANRIADILAVWAPPIPPRKAPILISNRPS
jgi:UDP-hydrolysing UDP-N-acetyl-D-glucosamine 2-epimerase